MIDEISCSAAAMLDMEVTGPGLSPIWPRHGQGKLLYAKVCEASDGKKAGAWGAAVIFLKEYNFS